MQQISSEINVHCFIFLPGELPKQISIKKKTAHKNYLSWIQAVRKIYSKIEDIDILKSLFHILSVHFF